MMQQLQPAILMMMLLLAVVGPTNLLVSAFVMGSGGDRHTLSSRRMAISDAARDLLYQDQQQAMLRRSLVEEELLTPVTSPLQAPKLKAVTKSGTGFAASAQQSSQTRLAIQQAKTLKKQGVLLVPNALPEKVVDPLRAFILEQQQYAVKATQDNPALSTSFYGVEQARAHRCDLQLSLLRGGFHADDDETYSSSSSSSSTAAKKDHVVADALQEILGEQGSLRSLYEQLVTLQGEFYELAAVVTHPGSHRQTIHPDLPFQDPAPLYVVFVALQDVTADMGPTSFLIKTHTKAQNAIFSNGSVDEKDEQLSKADCRLSCLKKGDAVVFDARVLHCGNANASDTARAMFNFSFRNPKITGSLGYEGSIRPGYEQAMSLQDVGDALRDYEQGNPDPFAKYGSGLL